MDNFELPKEKVDKVKENPLHPGDADAASKLKRDHHSLDDFEHLEHDTSPIQESKDMAASFQGQQDQAVPAQFVDVPRAVGEVHPASIDKHDAMPNSQRSLLDSSLPADEVYLQPAPATPPPSADFAKRTLADVLDKPINDVDDILGEVASFAQASKPFHPFHPTPLPQGADPKAASLAFMDSERSLQAYNPSQPTLAKDVKPAESRPQENLFAQDPLITEIKPEKTSAPGASKSVAEDPASQLQHALDARVGKAKPKTTEKSESFEELFEDIAQAALKMPEIQDIIDPKEDLFGLEDIKNDQMHGDEALERDLFGPDNDAYGQVKKPDTMPATQDNSTKLMEGLNLGNVEVKTVRKPEEDFLGEIKSSVLPEPQKPPTIDFLKDDSIQDISKETAVKHVQQQPFEDDSWNVVEKPDKFEKCEPLQEKFDDREPTPEPPNKSLPPIPRDASPEPISSGTPEPFQSFAGKGAPSAPEKYELSSDFIATESGGQNKFLQTGAETGDSEFESDPESCPLPPSRLAQPEFATKTEPPKKQEKPDTSAGVCYRKDPVEEIAPKEIFREMGLDAWFNPERLNPKVEALIYWRDPKKSGIVFGVTLGVLLSLAYFSLISVLAYISLITLTGTVAFRVYKTVLQAVQKTSDGHPFKDVLDVDLNVPAEKVHDIADVAVAHANAAIAELRRLFLVEDLVDSLKFGVLLWCLTYLGAWFNGMTLIIIGVVALFTLPKVYETNKTQIDQNIELVRGKINDLTSKVKAAIPIGKKSEPTKEE
ncbi:reticulon-4 isoform X1 [Neodiprion lecontei]|uniref:Reticulon-like protein n=1 Tax=Neodiprion lecontei TaxID=441921 RepID=A0A6J0BNF7_NEOLC|nr:reticulon-4 isoform X1 [Neodiprion lecontei]